MNYEKYMDIHIIFDLISYNKYDVSINIVITSIQYSTVVVVHMHFIKFVIGPYLSLFVLLLSCINL